MTSSNATPKAKFSLQCVQLHADEAFRVNEFEKFVNLNEKGASVNYLPVLVGEGGGGWKGVEGGAGGGGGEGAEGYVSFQDE